MNEKQFIRLKKYHSVKYDNPHIQSLASLILLKEKLFKNENPKSHWRSWVLFRYKYLRSMKKTNKLICIYCGTRDLKIEHKKGTPKKQRATIDHVIPISKGGDMYDINNLVVACYNCNNKKADKIEFKKTG